MNRTQEIRDILARVENAMSAKDAAGVVAHYADDAVMFELAPPLRFPAPDEAGLQSWFDEARGDIDWSLHDVAIAVDGDVAFCHGLTRLTGKTGEPGDGSGGRDELWFRSTFGFRRVDHRWVIAHTHNSTPFAMDGSERACLDLKP